jgi:hypothetical protein
MSCGSFDVNFIFAKIVEVGYIVLPISGLLQIICVYNVF